MISPHSLSSPIAGQVSAQEWQARVSLAAAYRLLALTDVFDLTYNHLSARVPGQGDAYLIKGEQQLFREVTASSLVKYDFAGNRLLDSPYSISAGGQVIHGGVLQGRPDLQAVFHTHTPANMALSALKVGLLPITQHAVRFHGHLAYHDFEGFEFDAVGRDRILASMGDKRFLVMRNHGVLIGGRTIPEAFVEHHFFEWAARAQIGALHAAGGVGGLVIPDDAVSRRAAQQVRARGPISESNRDWPALIRWLDEVSPDYQT
ncbi:class II aldolase/adducin family protein [Bordetella sp. BOR01]|uniref:class II aldolase/adducin family protein n=1 Tax=Bordetella sp. BOR01 TaxID=2854779 RepID=UPI001C465B53|nr:class II aldolase/adducin family protein [Bordetella sp. BOR01]MBV7481680.1 class II aldolase/adducin family protein [Bordetella sp. BOR01]